ncbi:MAG: hypothetical protein ACOC7N_05230, partial [Chloroflexota bacterium]
GEIYYSGEAGEIGILVLRLGHQTVEAVNDVLARFLGSKVFPPERLRDSLVVLSGTTYRVYQGRRGAF